ncbi:MAG: TonB-dependent receptor plug domain-containing protein, partial [Rhodospirillales bacterium]|nr:TonB-dependent receptor plug domain-containing protein [Rhodospirillales bacterium]
MKTAVSHSAARHDWRAWLCLTTVLMSTAPALAEDNSGQSFPSAPRLGEVIVTAPMLSEPLTVETDPRNPRQPVPPADGAGYLKNIPGFSVIRKGGIDGDPLLRGQGGSRLDVQLDGTPLLGGCGNRMDPPTAYIFPDSFDKLTVLKGPQSVVHGGTALGTVLVERETKRFQDLSYRGNASALYGSFDRNDEVLDLAGGDKPGFIRVIGTHSSSDDYKDGSGRAVHSKYWRRNGTAMLGWTPSDDTALVATIDKSEAEAAYADRAMDGSKFDREGVNLRFTRKNLSSLVAKVQAQAYYNYVDHIMDGYSLRLNNRMGANNPDHLMEGGKALVELTPRADTKITMGTDVNHDLHSVRNLTNAQYLAGQRIEDKTRVS